MKLALTFLFAVACNGQTIGGKASLSGHVTFGAQSSVMVTVLQSNTQAVLSYTAPDSNPCIPEVSESATYSPLVHDVDSAIFTGANSDSRSGALTNGASRVLVIGKRATELGLDSAYYSRALQALTTHYYRITCGSAVATGSFATANIPIGSTGNELVKVDAATGSAIIPTFPNNRTATVIDEQTGALAKRVNLDAEGNGLSLYSGGRIPVCGYQLVGPGPGYLCSFPNLEGNPAPLYYIIPTTGEARYLGTMYKAGVYGGGGVGLASTFFDPSNPLYTYTTVEDEIAGHTLIVKFTYTGDYGVTPVSAGNWASLSTSLVTSNLKALLTAYDPTFDGSKFSCDFLIGGAYGLITCKRGIQDSYAWMFAMRMSDATIVAGIPVWKNANSRWCGNHSTFIVANTALVGMLPHEFSEGVISGPNLGLGPYETTLNGAIGANDTSIVVAGEPLNATDGGAEPYLMDAAIGDQFILGFDQTSIMEWVTLTGKSGNNWTVDRQTAQEWNGHTKRVWPSGTTVRAWCENNGSATQYDMWWKFLADPTGAGSGYFPDHYIYVSHKDVSPEGQVEERDGVIGPIMSSLDVPHTYSLSLDPKFAGVAGMADGNSMSTYPAYHQLNATTAEKQWFLDEPTFFGATQLGTGATLISGQLYKYVFGTWGGLHRKKTIPWPRWATGCSPTSVGRAPGISSAPLQRTVSNTATLPQSMSVAQGLLSATCMPTCQGWSTRHVLDSRRATTWTCASPTCHTGKGLSSSGSQPTPWGLIRLRWPPTTELATPASSVRDSAGSRI